MTTANYFPATTLSITTGATWQVLFPLNQNRNSLYIVNYSTATFQGLLAQNRSLSISSNRRRSQAPIWPRRALLARLCQVPT